MHLARAARNPPTTTERPAHARLIPLFIALCLAPTLALAQMATAPFEGRLKKIHDTKTISVAYRTDAIPFSFEDENKKPSGYTVDLCRSVIGVIERQIGVTPAGGEVGAGDAAEPLHDHRQRRRRHGMRRQHGDAGPLEGSELLVA